ncbi:MAG TPA: glycosyltransferase family 39 protein, partial [Fimbriimonadaceae bacterium]|nr:glycosyltransferase family 39 protein [Fimbriimonadaceae bacterium]
GRDFGPRLPSVVCALLTALVLFRFLKRRTDIDLARIATAAYGGSLLVVGTGRLLLADAPLVLALVIAFTTFYDSIDGQPKKRLLTAIALGFAVLAKGPVACVLFALLAGFTYWRMPELRPNFKGYWLTGFALFAVVVAAWYVPCYLANGHTFVHDFLYEQNIGRFSGRDLAHKTYVWMIPFYFPLAAYFAMLPWSIWPKARSWFQQPEGRLMHYLWIWGIVVIAFFSLSMTKLPHYVLPAIAPLTVVVVARALERWKHKHGADFWLKCALAWSCVIAAVATPVFYLYSQSRFAEVQQIATYLNSLDGTPVLFGTGRQSKDEGMSATLNETSHPSFFFYLDREGLMTGDVEDVAKIDGVVDLVAKPERLDAETLNLLALSGFRIRKRKLPFMTKQYGLWRLEPVMFDRALVR